jgi:hypothetical protein
MQKNPFAPFPRVRQKEAARRLVDAELESGRVSHSEMQARNSIFASVDFSQARIVMGDVDPVL